MLRGFLISEKDTKGPRRVPVGPSIVIGRSADCGFVIDDGAASRRHVQVVDRGGDFHWKDLGSTNGTIINGSRMLEGRLRPGDRIQIGDTVLRFDVEEVSDRPVTPEDSTMFKQTIMDDRGHVTTRAIHGRAEHLLQALYTVMDEIASNYEVCSLVERILETTVSAVGAERGAVFFAGTDADALVPCPSCGRIHIIEDGRLGHTTPETLQISSTVVQRVLEGGESVLFQQGGGDTELDAAQSIVSLKLGSVLCVPLRAKMGILGVLYLDSTRKDRSYSQDDMLLAMAVGKSAGLAIENANMHRQILEKQRIEQEIEFAWTIQQGFLVKSWPEAEERFQVYGETRPAKTVGGDFYDFARPDPTHIGILIGDVSGKGVPAALTMAQILAEFRLRAQGVCSPAEVLQALNRDLTARSRHGMFCSMCYICIDLETGRGLCANAGHHSPVYIGTEGPRLVGEATGPPAGILDAGPWHDISFEIRPGDSILLYTDGIVEARKPRNGALCEFGVEALMKSLENDHGRPPQEVIGDINREVEEFCAPAQPHDDCTLIALRLLP